MLERHGTKTRRSWCKLHQGKDTKNGRIFTSTLTARDEDDGSQVGSLLDQIAGPLASFTRDGACK